MCIRDSPQPAEIRYGTGPAQALRKRRADLHGKNERRRLPSAGLARQSGGHGNQAPSGILGRPSNLDGNGGSGNGRQKLRHLPGYRAHQRGKSPAALPAPENLPGRRKPALTRRNPAVPGNRSVKKGRRLYPSGSSSSCAGGGMGFRTAAVFPEGENARQPACYSCYP